MEKTITLRCADGQEACVFHRYDFVALGHTMYAIDIEDSYIGENYKGFFGRVKRAWKAFFAKPVCYTGIYRDDKESMQKFLQDCLNLMEEE